MTLMRHGLQIQSIQENQTINFRFSDFVSQSFDFTQYYRYKGSLTAPPCTQGIIWNVFAQTINISTAQVEFEFFSRYNFTLFKFSFNFFLMIFKSYTTFE